MTGIGTQAYDRSAIDARLGWGRRLGYACGNAGLMIGLSPITLLLLFYLTDVIGLRAGQAALAIALPRLWDALIGPALGAWIERLAANMKRRTPIALVAGGGYLAGLVLLFSLPQLQSAIAIQIAVILLLILSSVSETAFTVSQFALATELTGSESELSALLSLSGGIGQASLVAAAAMAPLLVARSGGGRAGYALMAGEIALVAALAIAAFVAATARVPVRHAPADAAPLSLRAALRVTAVNRAFYCLMAYLLCLSAASAFIGSVLPFASRYVLASGENGLALLAAASGAGIVAGMSLAPWLARHLGAGRAIRLCTLAIAALLGALFLVGYGPIWGSWIAIAGVGLAAGAATILLQTIILETVEYRMGAAVVATGVYLGIMVAGFKLGASLGSLAAGALLELIGFASGGARQTVVTLIGLRVGYTLVPLILVVVGDQFLRRYGAVRNGLSASRNAA